MKSQTEITEEEFKRLQIIFDTKDIMYSSHVLHTKQFPSWAIFDHDMDIILYSTKKDGEIVFYLTQHGKNHLELLSESYTYKDGTEILFS
jgi:hypothetical protein